MVSNVDFFPCCNGCIIWKNSDIVKKLGEHAHTQVEMCDQLIM